MLRSQRAHRALVAAAFLCAVASCARAPIVVRQPSWTGRAPSTGSPSYGETLEVLHFLSVEYPQSLRQQVSAPAPCVLRVVRGDDLSNPDAASGSVYESTWIDLSRVTELHARSSGPEAGPRPSPGTCASLGGKSGFALHTEIVSASRGKPARHFELADERSPRICLGNRAHPERLAAPLRQLVTLCGGRTAR